MKVVGQYKGCHIFLDSVHIKRTYGDFLGLSGQWLHEANSFLFETIPEDFQLYNPRELPVIIIKGKEYDEKKLLPRIMVIGEFTCDTGSGRRTEEYALIVVWFQEKTDDFFVNAQEVIKQVNWSDCAKVFWDNPPPKNDL